MLSNYPVIIIFLIWVLLFTVGILWMSQKISIIGIYHRVHGTENKLENNVNESFILKCQKVCSANFYLGIPFVISYYVVIQNTLNDLDIIDGLNLSFILSLASLFSLRILANPTHITSPVLCDFYPENDHMDLVKVHKERIMSFFYSFICAALIILGIIASTSSSNIPLPQLSYYQAICYVVYYFAGVICITLVTETFLYYVKPIDQIN